LKNHIVVLGGQKDVKMKDMTGKKFGRWTVLEWSGYSSPKDKRAMWKCICECGKIGIISGTSLRLGTSKSCGCLQKESTIGNVNNRINLVGRRFGRLIVIEFGGHDKYQGSLWKVKCDCGTVKIVNGNGLRRGYTTSCGCYNLERSIEANCGENNHQWRGGVSLLSRGTIRYMKWRNDILNRDNYICQMCGKNCREFFEVHHIYPFGDYENLRFKVWNGITLCKKCHRSIKNKEYRFINTFIDVTLGYKNKLEEESLG